MKHHRRCPFARLAASALLASLAAVAAACSNSPAQPTQCTVTLGQATTAVPAAGVSSSVSVTANSGCAWTATASAAFITITQGATGNGNGTVGYTIAPNTTTTARTGSITVAGTSITFTQAAAAAPPPAAPTLAVPALQSPAGGAVVDSLTPTLVVNNAAATGAVGAVSYRFEVSDVDSFQDSRTQVGDNIPQGGGATTSWPVARGLNPNTTYFWRARASGGSLTTAFTGAETFRTPNICSISLSTTTISIGAAGGTANVNVSAPGSCSWTATSNASFITITAGGSGSGDGTVTISVASSAGVARSGTLTIAGQTVTVNQQGSGVIAAFNLFDPSTQAGPATECWFRSNGAPTTCTLTSTSFTSGPLPIVSYAWTINYTYVTAKTITGTTPSISFSDTCGQPTSTADGVAQPLNVTLTVTDSAGNTATATSGSGGQPALSVRLFTCGP